MNLLQSLRRGPESRYSLAEYLKDVSGFNFGGNAYQVHQTMAGSPDGEGIGNNYTAYVQRAYKSNGVVFACMLARMMLFSEARFAFRALSGGRPADLFGTPALGLLERPWPNATTGDLLARMIQDVDLAGNAYVTLRDGQLHRLRPDWTSIVVGSRTDPEDPAGALDSTVYGYIYQPGGPAKTDPPVALAAEQVAHFAPIPDPEANFRGMSWLTPLIRDIDGDTSTAVHKQRFFNNAATPNMVVTFDPSVTVEAVRRFKAMVDEEHVGIDNAFKTLYLGGGADAKVVGNSFEQMSFKAVQAAGETRICAAAGVPSIIVGLSEGLASATYSNYGQARRQFADGTMRPLWRNAAASLATLIDEPPASQLWYDDRDIPFLQADVKDAAEVQRIHADAIRSLTDAGYEPESVVAAVTSGDLTLLQHTHLFSVQLQPAGSTNGSPNGQQPAPAE